MSSSIFAESPVSTNESRMSDSNLVVVYGKNGVNNVDREGLENLIDDKGVSTISVVRLTSPTPSMKEEEMAENETKKSKKKENEESDSNEKKNKIEDGEQSEKSTDTEVIDSGQETDEESKEKELKEKPETVGLIIEDFCLPEKTKEITKAALALSGLQPLSISVNFEIQVKALKNDHCYTPLTSPSQLHDRKPDPKPLPTSTISAVTSAKAAQKMAAIKAKNAANRAAAALEKSNENDNNNKKSVDESEDNETLEDENESEYSESDQSADTDNDRDSDLDFDVNDRTGRKRKSNKKILKRKFKSKISKKRQSTNSELNTTQDDDKKVNKALRVSVDKPCGPQSIPHIAPPALIHKTTTPTKYNPVQSSVKMLISSNKAEIRTQNRLQSPNTSYAIVKSPQTQIIQKNSRPDVLSNIITGTGKPSGDPSGKPVVQNVVIIKPPNKKLGNTSGGFTDITKYLSKSENMKATNVQVCELIKPDRSGAIILRRNEQEMKSTQSSNILVSNSSPSRLSKKGFMPLVPDKTKSQLLPAQISVQIQQKGDKIEQPSQRDLENQEEIDIIDSLVGQIQNSEQTKPDVNSSKTTKPCEGTNSSSQNFFINQQSSQKKSIMIHSNTSHSAFTSTAAQVDSVDISNAPLLETPDEIPEDLIKDMAELIDHKTLQELVEEQRQQQLHNQRLSQSFNVTDFETSIPKSFLMQSTHQNETKVESTSKNVLIKSQETKKPNRYDSILGNKEIDTNIDRNNYSTKENQSSILQQPVQVISRSGRLITLPPIEAPTTRAKRRAAAGLTPADTPTPPMSSNVSEASESEFPVTPKTGQAMKLQRGSNSRRNSKDQLKKSTIDSNKKQKPISMTTSINEESFESHDESSQGEDEDDPNKLWCICRQPHNNRFMICCDSCEDWFHGTCVGVTKSMGKEMELNKTEWTCPNCKDGKKQQTIKTMFEKQSEFIANSNLLTPKSIIQERKEKIKNPNKKPDKRKSTEIPVISPTITPLSKSMQLKISEIIGVPLPEPVASSLENVERQSSNDIIQKKKPLTNKTIKHLSGTKDISEKGVSNKKKVTPKIRENSDLALDLNKSTENLMKSPQESLPEVEILPCIVCKKEPARPNSIYCSDDCIRKHANSALTFKATKNQLASGNPSPGISTDGTEKKKKQPSSFEEALGNASLLTQKKIERVSVFERKTGKILTGNNAPTTTNLKRWLQENPTFEVIQPGSPQAQAIERNKLKQKTQVIMVPEAQQRAQSYRQQSNRPQTQQKNVIKIIKSISSNPSPKSDGQFHEINEVIHKPVAQKLLTFHHISPLKGEKSETKNENKPETGENKVERQDKPKSDKAEKNEKIEKQCKSEKSPSKVPIKKQSSKEKERDKELDKDRNQSSEPIRLNVKRTLKEKLITRLMETKEENHPKLSEIECENYANETEEEMFELFKDTGVKYKAKYRSLAFNIKDHKNKTLFRKICEKSIEPKQLVRMTPEELASQELAQWRENENKHQLEMIKKSELDLLSCAKNYVLKTHKGEEVIEDKMTDRVNLDITIPVEDVVTVLNNSTVSSTSEVEKIILNRESLKSATQMQENDIDSSLGNSVIKTETMVSELQNVNEADDEKKKEIKKDKEREKRHKNKDRHREKSSRRSRSRSRSRDRKRHKTPQKDEDSRPHQHKTHGKEKFSRSPELDIVDFKNRKDISETYDEVDKAQYHHIEQEEELHGFDEPEFKYKYNLLSANDDKKKKDKEGQNEHFENKKEMDEGDQDHASYKPNKKEGKSHHHSHRTEDDRSTHHDHKRRSYTHSPSVEDDDEKRKRRHHSHHHHKSTSLISGGSPTTDFEEGKKDISLKAKIDTKSSAATSTTTSEILGSSKKHILSTINKQISSNKLHKNNQKSVNQKSRSTDLSEYSLIDKIFAESEKTIEEAANLVPLVIGKEKSLIKPADSQSSLAKSPSETLELREVKDGSGNDSEQELPSSTVTIPTPPEDPYKYYASDTSTIIWTGNINMIDVATFNIVIQPLSGNCTNIEKEFPMELDVVGRIGPDTVWDYISKIKKSPNKEIVLVRLIPSPETENNAYIALYLYLEKRKRLGVVKSTSPGIKDFYVLPLHSKTELPVILQTVSNSEFFDDDSRPDLLIGIIIRIMDYGHSKRYITASTPSSSILSEAVTKIVRKSITSTVSSTILRGETTVIQNNKILGLSDSTDLGEEDYKPESPHMNVTGTKVFSIFATKTTDNAKEIQPLNVQHNSDNVMYDADDADEPYSPGGSSDEDSTILPSAKTDITTANNSSSANMTVCADELQRKVEELTRQIEKEKKEIENLGTVTLPATTAELAPALANISIPSNLQQILASIHKPEPAVDLNLIEKVNDTLTNTKTSATNIDEEYDPGSTFYDVKSTGSDNAYKKITSSTQNSTPGGSRLASLSEAELLKMVPDNIDLTENNSNSKVSVDHQNSPPPLKKSRWDIDPPPPGLEDEYE